MRHIVNKHEWSVASVYHQCAHEELSEEDERTKQWLKPGSPSHKALQAIVTDKRLLKDIESVSGRIKLATYCSITDFISGEIH